jgi:hypothetical protein
LTLAYTYMNVSFGFLNGTSLYGTPQTIYCQSNVTRQLQLFLNDIPKSFSPFSIFSIVYSLSESMAKLYNTQHSCRLGTLDAIARVDLYAEGYADYWAFLDTFSFNFGLIYDSVLTAA